MERNELRKHRCCFTGHRLEKLKQSESKIRYALEKEIRTAVDKGFTVFISGMARGVDIWAAEIVLQLRDEGGTAQAHLRQSLRGLRARMEKRVAGVLSERH